MTGRWAGLWVLLASLVAFGNSLTNGFALDDQLIVETNPMVTEGQWGEVPGSPYWQAGVAWNTLYRPLTTAAFVAQWRLWRGRPLGFHAVNVLTHALVSLGVLALLWTILPPRGALAGGLFFAVHPVHVEAVANVVGLAEVLATLLVVAACLLYLHGAEWSSWKRGLRVVALVALYLAGLSAKEMAVTLPALLVLLEFFRRGSPGDVKKRLGREVPVYVALGAALVTYLAWRGWVLGGLGGERPAPIFFGLDGVERLLTAVSVWPEYVRLLTLPLSLSADYGPPLLAVSRGVTPEVFAGLLVLAGVVAAVTLGARRSAALALGVAWVGVALLPISNLLFPVGVLLAERTLYLPSVGAALVVGAGAAWLMDHPRFRVRRMTILVLPVLGAVLLGRTVTRNPVWLSTFTVIEALSEDHPESYYAHWKRGEGLALQGRMEEARANYDVAVALSPGHYGLLCAAADFMYQSGDAERSAELLLQAVGIFPDQPNAYRLLGGQLLQRGLARQAHGVVLAGLANYGPDRQLWAYLAETYVAKGDLEAAVRALSAALAAGPEREEDRARLAQLQEAIS